MKFYWVNAFTDQKLAGNPCAVVLGADSLSDEKMLRLAKEMNLSETAFVMESKVADFKARYFTPAEEIPLAGHPTLSVARALIDSKQLNLEAQSHFTLELPAGIISVEVNSDSQKIFMNQNKPEFLNTHDKELIADLFSLKKENLLEGFPIQTVSTGTPMLIVPLKNQEALKQAKMQISKYKDYKKSSDFFSPHLFCLKGFTQEGQTSARHFGTPPDTLEDPFTGSATGCMSAYLWHHKLIKEPTFIAEQGHWMGRPGQAEVRILGTHIEIDAVKVGGRAVTLIQGEIDLS